MQSSAPLRHNHSLGSNPWIFLNPSYANALLILFVVFVFIIDLIIVSIHWNISSCSDILKLWIIGKYFAPLLSYFSCCLFIPCNFEETIEVITSIPYSQHELRQSQISQIRSIQNIQFIQIPYPFDIMLSEWFVSPSTITTNIAESMDNGICKIYIYFIGIIFDRGILELMWLFIGGLSIITEDTLCRNNTPILYYYVLLQIILGAFITLILILWMISSSICPLQVARLMACCYGMECDILGLLPRHLFQKLLTMHNNNNNNNNIETENASIIINSNNNKNKNYHTLSRIPHTFNDDDEDDICCELTTSSTTRICAICHHKMEYLGGDNNTLECGHEFHSVCIDSWPINVQCPQCSKT